MKMTRAKWYWYLICAVLIVLGCVLLFSGYDFAQMLKSTRRVIGTDTYLLGKKSALTLSFQITGGILLAGGLFAGLTQLKSDLKP